jgi:hypothetical protein
LAATAKITAAWEEARDCHHRGWRMATEFKEDEAAEIPLAAKEGRQHHFRTRIIIVLHQQ